MARKISEIKKSMGKTFVENPTNITKYALAPDKTFEEQFSTVSLESILFDVFAVAIWTLEVLWDNAIKKLLAVAAEGRGPYLTWYIKASLAFQYGYDLVENEIFYDNTGIDTVLIDESKVVHYAAASGIFKGVRIKVARNFEGDLAPLSTSQIEAFEHYWQRIQPPGLNRLVIVNQEADKFKLDIDVYFNPLVLDDTGARRDGTNDVPLATAIKQFTTDLVFNGRFERKSLENRIENVDGIENWNIRSMQAKYADTDWLDIEVSYVPDAGYLRLFELNVNYIPSTAVNYELL